MTDITEYVKIRRPITPGIDQWVIINRTGNRVFYFEEPQLPVRVVALMEGFMTRYFMADFDTDTKQYTIIRPTREQDW